jgi:hypothetical protein
VRRLVEGMAITIVGHGIILYLATIEIFPDRVVASMITTVAAAPVWAHWIMAGLFGLLGTFLLEHFYWNRRASLAPVAAVSTNGEIATTAIAAQTPPIDEPDVWLLDAMWRAFRGTWDVPEGGIVSLNVGESENQRFAMLIIQEFPQLAFDEELPIWGRRKGSFRWEPIPPDFWTHNHIDHILVMSADPQDDIKAMPDNPWEKPDTSGDWRHFKTSKAVIERLYPLPRKQLWRKFSASALRCLSWR